MMPHRSYRGRIAYLRDGQGERGRETFNVTVHADGTRTVRAFCEMDDIRLLRDTTYSVDAAWRPLDAFVRLVSQDRFVGSAWFRFDDLGVECESYTALDGRVSQRQDLGRRPRLFVPHPLVCDGWQGFARTGHLLTDWVSLKFWLLAAMLFCGIMIRTLGKPTAPTLAQIFATGSTPELEETLRRTGRLTRPFVLGLWALLVVAAYVGISKPEFGTSP